MKMIVAVIKPSRLDAVLDAVTEAGASGMTVTEVRGYGRQRGKTEVYRGAEYEVKLLPKVKLEIAVPDDIVEAVVEAITRAGQHRQDRRRQGLRHGPGKRAAHPHRRTRRRRHRGVISASPPPGLRRSGPTGFGSYLAEQVLRVASAPWPGCG